LWVFRAAPPFETPTTLSYPKLMLFRVSRGRMWPGRARPGPYPQTYIHQATFPLTGSLFVSQIYMLIL
jgi:hypothetical protein